VTSKVLVQPASSMMAQTHNGTAKSSKLNLISSFFTWVTLST